MKRTVFLLCGISLLAQPLFANCNGATMFWGDWIIILAPFMLFFFFMFFFGALLRKGNFSLSSALLEKNPDNNENSTSRLIALLSGFVALITVISMLSYFFYMKIRCDEEINFTALTNVFLTLGIGVVPYAFNQVKAMFSTDGAKKG